MCWRVRGQGTREATQLSAQLSLCPRKVVNKETREPALGVSMCVNVCDGAAFSVGTALTVTSGCPGEQALYILGHPDSCWSLTSLLSAPVHAAPTPASSGGAGTGSPRAAREEGPGSKECTGQAFSHQSPQGMRERCHHQEPQPAPWDHFPRCHLQSAELPAPVTNQSNL